eukprot:403349384
MINKISLLRTTIALGLFTVSIIAQNTPPEQVIISGDWGTWQSTMSPVNGGYACGAALKSEPNQGSADDSAANGLRLIFCKIDDWKNQNLVTAIEGLWGTWAPTVMCPVGQFIAGFRVKYETKYNGDNSALNGLSFLCQQPFSDLITLAPHVVFEGLWGNWSETVYTSRYLNKGLIKDVTAKWQPAQCGGFLGSCDDTALNGFGVSTTTCEEYAMMYQPLQTINFTNFDMPLLIPYNSHLQCQPQFNEEVVLTKVSSSANYLSINGLVDYLPNSKQIRIQSYVSNFNETFTINVTAKRGSQSGPLDYGSEPSSACDSFDILCGSSNSQVVGMTLKSEFASNVNTTGLTIEKDDTFIFSFDKQLYLNNTNCVVKGNSKSNPISCTQDIYGKSTQLTVTNLVQSTKQWGTGFKIEISFPFSERIFQLSDFYFRSVYQYSSTGVLKAYAFN